MESANLPMIGMVHLSPGKWRFLYRYTDCSRINKETKMTVVVTSHVADWLEGREKTDGKESKDAPDVEDTDREESLSAMVEDKRQGECEI